MADIWAEYDIGLAANDGARYRNYNEIRRDGIREYLSGLRRTKTVKILVSNDPAYHTYRKGLPLWTTKMHFYGEIYGEGGKFYFKDKSGKVRRINENGSFAKKMSVRMHPFGL